MPKQYQNINYSLLSTNSVSPSETIIQQKQLEDRKVMHEVNLILADSESQADSCDVSSKMKHKIETKRTINENITTVVHLFTIQFVVFILYLSFSHDVELFTWHPILLSVGWSLFVTESILAISGENWCTKNISAKNRVLLHWILQIYASICILSGFIIVVVNKNNKNKEHFKTWHGTIGLATIIFYFSTCLIGVLSLYKIELSHYINPKLNKLVHIFFGAGTFILGAVTVILSVYSNWFVKKANGTAQVVCFIACIVTSVWVLSRPVKYLSRSIFQR